MTAATAERPSTDPGRTAPSPPARRVLAVSANMGGGHDATAAALEAAARELWPGSEIRRLDTLDVLGPGVGRLFRAIYVANVERTPWLYEFFYSSLWRRRWFASSSKRVTGSWCGRRLASHIDRFDPDLVVSTYPLGSSGLAWLRRHRGLGVPLAAYVSDFAPHPFWVYPDIDVNFVMHESAVPSAHAAEPRAVVDVCGPPVVRAFHPGDRQAARTELDLAHSAFVVLVSFGAYAFGDVERIARALLQASPDVQVVAACGRNERTRAHLESLGLPPERLRVLGWTDRMAAYTQAADLVVSNAGGATALEALASGRPVVLSHPIAAHGTANAGLMVVAGLADVCAAEDELTSYVRAAVADRSGLRRLEQRATVHSDRHDLRSGLQRLGGPRPTAGGPRPAGRPWPMRGADAFFAHVESPTALQETGVVLELADVAPGRPLGLAELRTEMASRVPGLPPMRRQRVRHPRPGWLLRDAGDVDVGAHVVAQVLDPADPGATVESAVDAVWSAPLPDDRPAWSMTLIRDPLAGRTVLAIKLHHCQGDGISALGLLDRLLRADPDDPLVERGRPDRSRPAVRGRREALRSASLRTRRVGTGLWSLATRGTAPRLALNRQVEGAARMFVCVPLPGTELRTLARAARVHPHELALAVAATALGGTLVPAGLVPPDATLRAMVPIAIRPPVLDRVFGNWTGSIALDLAVAPMPFAERLAAVHAELKQRAARGEPDAGHVVMGLAGTLPPRLHGGLTRLAYHPRFFNTITSYLPGPRGPRWCAGARVLAAYPVVPLAARMPFTWGLLLFGDTAGVGVMMDPALGIDRADVARAVQDAFAQARESRGG